MGRGLRRKKCSRSIPRTTAPPYTYQPNSDRLDHVSGGIVGSRAYTYDANGTVRRIDANGQSVWLSTDYNGMPIRMDFNTGAGAGSVYSTMAYSGLNQRSFYHDAGGINHYNSYDGAEPGAALLSDSINVYTPGISQHSAAGSRFYVSDAQGSLRGTHDPNTTLTNDLRFDAFGQQDFHGGASPSALPLAWHQSSNYQTDNDSGLMLLGNRYYDSVVGRFISPDPAGDGDNWYAYCGNDPVGEVDPEGLFAYGMSAPTGASFGNPLGQMESFLTTTSAGHWSHGAPTNYSLSGQPVNSTTHGETWQATQWVPDDSASFQLVDNTYQRPGESNLHYFLRGLKWAIEQAATNPYDPVAMRGPNGRFQRDPNATKTPEFNAKKARKAWEQAKGRPWPKDPRTGENFDAHHIQPKSQGGSLYDPDNITPVHPTMHDRLHAGEGPYSP